MVFMGFGETRARQTSDRLLNEVEVGTKMSSDVGDFDEVALMIE